MPERMPTINVTTAPNPLIAAFVLQFASFSRWKCFTIPAWDSVNERKTPMAYRGIRGIDYPMEHNNQDRREDR